MISIVFYIYTVLILTVFFLLSCIALVVCYPFDKQRKVVHELSRMLCMTFWHTPFLWRRNISGLENVDKKKPYVIVINHNSMVDIISLYFVPLQFRWVSKREVFRIPYIGAMLSLHGDIAIERGKGAESMRKVISKGKEWISRGVSIAMFPEGTRSKDGEIHRFKQGAFLLAKEAEVEILPVVMEGTTKVIRKNFMFNWRHLLSIKVLPPISVEEVVATEPSDMMEKVHAQMTEALALLREESKQNK